MDAPASQPPRLPTSASAKRLRTPQLPAHSYSRKTTKKKKSARSRNAANTAQGCTALGEGPTGMLQECWMSSLASVNQQNQLKFWAGLHQVRMWPAWDRILIILILKKERNQSHKEILFQSFNSLSYTSPCSEYPDFMQVHSLL